MVGSIFKGVTLLLFPSISQRLQWLRVASSQSTRKQTWAGAKYQRPQTGNVIRNVSNNHQISAAALASSGLDVPTIRNTDKLRHTKFSSLWLEMWETQVMNPNKPTSQQCCLLQTNGCCYSLWSHRIPSAKQSPLLHKTLFIHTQPWAELFVFADEKQRLKLREAASEQTTRWLMSESPEGPAV